MLKGRRTAVFLLSAHHFGIVRYWHLADIA
jgi:hypothetical protein